MPLPRLAASESGDTQRRAIDRGSFAGRIPDVSPPAMGRAATGERAGEPAAEAQGREGQTTKHGDESGETATQLAESLSAGCAPAVGRATAGKPAGVQSAGGQARAGHTHRHGNRAAGGV